MEYVPGTSLRPLISRASSLSIQDAIAIMRQVLAGLATPTRRGWFTGT